MRLAIVSDIHGHLVPLEAVIADLKQQSPDLVVHGGDVAAIGPRPAEVIDRIRELGWSGVIGNTDEIVFDRSNETEQMRRAPHLQGWLHTLYGTLAPWAEERLSEDQVGWLRGLPRAMRRDDLLLVHASPTDLWRAPMPDATDEELVQVYGGGGAALAVYCHIHRPYYRKIGDLAVANTGSAGLPYDGDPRPSYLLIDDGITRVRRVSYNMERSAGDLIAAGFPLADWMAGVQRAGRFQQP